MIGILLFTVLMGTASAKASQVDVASDSNTILVHTDTYSENVDVNKRLPLQSEHDVVLTIVQSVLIIIVMMLLLRSMKRLYLQVFS